MSNPDITLPRPRFRPGKRVIYLRIDRDKADQAWRRIAHLDYLQVSRVIAKEMGVSTRTASLYRRAFDALDLIDDIPGEWNPPESYIAQRYATNTGHTLKRYNTGYSAQWDSGFVDYTALNTPAEIYISSAGPDAFSRLTEGYDLYVLRSRSYLSQSEHNIDPIGYGDGSRSPTGSGFFSPDYTTEEERDSAYRCEKKVIEGFRPLVLEPVTAFLGLCPKTNPIVGSNERSECTGCCVPVEKSLDEIMEITGWSQPAAYRRLKAGEGHAIKVGKGRWLVGVVTR